MPHDPDARVGGGHHQLGPDGRLFRQLVGCLGARSPGEEEIPGLSEAIPSVEEVRRRRGTVTLVTIKSYSFSAHW
jgi:hypothetical protein